MTERKLRFMVMVIKIRMNRGEDFNTIINSYPALNEKDKEFIRTELNIH